MEDQKRPKRIDWVIVISAVSVVIALISVVIALITPLIDRWWEPILTPRLTVRAFQVTGILAGAPQVTNGPLEADSFTKLEITNLSQKTIPNVLVRIDNATGMSAEVHGRGEVPVPGFAHGVQHTFDKIDRGETIKVYAYKEVAEIPMGPTTPPGQITPIPEEPPAGPIIVKGDNEPAYITLVSDRDPPNVRTPIYWPAFAVVLLFVCACFFMLSIYFRKRETAIKAQTA